MTKAKPKTIRHFWLNLLPVAFLIVLVALTVVEERTGFVERAAGAYLNWQNQNREPWGTSWERQQKTASAARQLDIETGDASRTRRSAELVSSFSELLPLLPDEGGVQLSPKKFVGLYQALPQALRGRILDPKTLTDRLLSGVWQRTSLWRKDGGVQAYLIDSQNKILQTVTINRELLEAAAIWGRVTPGRLEDSQLYAGRVYPSDRFFAALLQLPEPDRQSLFLDPGILLSLPQNVINVGFGQMAESEQFAVVGFESSGEEGSTVVTYPADAAEVSKLTWLLVWKDSDTLLIDDSSPSPRGIVLDEAPRPGDDR